ncbi:MAG: AraC family transcriptional regulator [Acidiferrobacterales bacterium]
MMYPSTIASWALLIWKALESYGCDPKPLFEQAGLDANRLHDPNARYPVVALTRLWRFAGQASKDTAFGLTAARFWHPTTFHALGYAWMASDSMREAFERLVRYVHLVSNAALIRFEERENDFCFTMGSGVSDLQPADEAIDAGMATILGMCRTSYGDHLNPLHVAMQRKAPMDRGSFARVFRAPIDYDASENMLCFGKNEINTPLSTANAELAIANERVVAAYLARFDRASLKLRVEATLLEQLSSGHATQESIARALHLSTRTLQRKLRDEGTTYKDLLDETRRQLAADYVKQSELSVNEITFLLGFSEPANFSRAFKRWTGLTPSQFRTQADLAS